MPWQDTMHMGRHHAQECCYCCNVFQAVNSRVEQSSSIDNTNVSYNANIVKSKSAQPIVHSSHHWLGRLTFVDVTTVAHIGVVNAWYALNAHKSVCYLIRG